MMGAAAPQPHSQQAIVSSPGTAAAPRYYERALAELGGGATDFRFDDFGFSVEASRANIG
jgi:hypothetical protein